MLVPVTLDWGYELEKSVNKKKKKDFSSQQEVFQKNFIEYSSYICTYM
jgi:hypothetical protein